MTLLPTPSFMEFVNMPDLLDRVDDDLEFMRELFQLFRVEFPRLQIELQEAVSRKDLQQAAKTAHMLKGMLANLSIERPASAMEIVEHAAVDEDQSGTEDALIVFRGKVLSLLPCLDAYLNKPLLQEGSSES
jgi:HPt (histidine-containing phosphotransfer) domain-containing protein